MNKLFTKVAALTLGVAMAAGVGVALGSANASKADAATGSFDLLCKFTTSADGTGTVCTSDGSTEIDSSARFLSTDGSVTANISKVKYYYFFAGDASLISADSITASKLFPGKNNTYKFASGSADGTLSFSLSNTDLYVTSVEITGFSSKSGATITVDEASDETKTQTVTSTSDTYTFIYSGTDTRSVSISVPSGKATNVSLIKVNYASGDTPTPATQYNVTDSVENGSVSPSKVNEGATLTATITPDTGYSLPETVSVTMGGQSAQSTYLNGVVTVENVTGDIVISGTCGKVHGQWEDDPYTISEAVAAITGSGVVNNVYVGGIVSQVDSYNSTYKSVTFWISADGTTTDQFEVYGCLKREGSFSSKDDIEVGATVLVKGNIKSFTQGSVTIYEFDKNCVLWTYEAPVHTDPTISLSSSKLEFVVGDEAQEITVSSDQFTAEPVITVEGEPQYVSCQVSGNKVTVSPVAAGSETVTIKGTNGNEADTAELTVVVYPAHGHKDSDPYTVAEAKAKLDAGAVAEKVYISGIITEIVKMGDKGGITYWISDDGASNEFEIFYGNNLNNEPFEKLTDIEVGASIINYGNITLYQSTTYEFTTGSYLVSYHAPAPTLESIAVSGEYKTQYGYQAEEFDKEGIVVTATYSDQSQQPVDLKDVEFSGYDKSVLGEQTVTVTYQEKTTTFKVTVYYTATYKPGEGTSEKGEYVEYIENPDNYELVAFEKTGFVAPTGKQFKEWSQGTTGKVAVSANGNLNFTAVYEDIPVQKFTITYKAGYGTGEDVVISNVEAGSSHTLITFAESKFVVPAGQQFKGWRVGSETELRNPGDEITNIQADVKIFANYENIPVTDWSDAFKTAYTSRFGSTYLPPFVSAEFADENAMYWFDGYPLGYVSVEGNLLSVAISAFNGKWQFVGDEQNEIYIFCDPNMRGFVQIVYDTDYGTTDLVFAAIGNVALDTTNVKKDYFVGDTVDTANLSVHPKLYNGTVVPGLYLPSTMWTVSPSTFTEAGAQDVTVTVSDFFTEPVELTYSVNVAAVVAQSISVSGQATKTSYNVGEEWSAEGLVVTAHYNNGTEADVTDQVTWSFDPAETAIGVTSVSAVAHLGDLSSDAFAFDVTVTEPVPTYDADAFAKELLDQVAPICANYDGKKNNKLALRTVWDTMSQHYSTLSNEEKAKVIATVAKTDGTDLQKAMAFYDYACKKYGLTKFIKDRPVKALIAQHETGNSILPIVVIVASSVAAITAIGVVIALKRRKALLAK